MKNFFLKFTGVGLLLLGVVGLFLPVLQGWLMIFAGLSLLSPALAAQLRRRLLLTVHRGPVVRLDEWHRYGARGGFTTRSWGVFLASTDDVDRDDARQALRALWDSQAPRPERFAYLRQVHGNRCAVVESGDFKHGDFYRAKDADALVTTLKGTVLLVLSADCLPILYAVVRGDRTVAIAAAHAGWRGTHRQVAVRTLEALVRRADAHLSEVRVAFGPSMDFKNYEVGEEFQKYFPDPAGLYRRSPLRRLDGRWHLDLRLENHHQLEGAGISPSQIVDTGLSTVAHRRLFYSHRLEQSSAGRTVSYLFIP